MYFIVCLGLVGVRFRSRVRVSLGGSFRVTGRVTSVHVGLGFGLGPVPHLVWIKRELFADSTNKRHVPLRMLRTMYIVEELTCTRGIQDFHCHVTCKRT